MRKNPLDKSWEFETSERDLAYKFIQILKAFHIEPYVTYIPSFLEYSQVKFFAPKKKKDQIKCVFNRYILPDPYKKFAGRRDKYYEIY